MFNNEYFQANFYSLIKAFNFCRKNLTINLLLILGISIISFLFLEEIIFSSESLIFWVFKNILNNFLLFILLGALTFYIRDYEFLEYNNSDLKRFISKYFKYGLSFGFLYILFIFLLIFLAFIFTLIFIVPFATGTGEGIVAVFGFFFILLGLINLVNILFYFLPLYINLILTASTPFEVLKINKKLFSLKFLKDFFNNAFDKKYTITVIIWIIFSLLIYFIANIISSVLNVSLFVEMKIGTLISIFTMNLVKCYLYIYLLYLANYIKQNFLNRG